MSAPGSLLVVGARPGSLGAAVAELARDEGFTVTTVGVSGQEDFGLDLAYCSTAELNAALTRIAPDHVVCTAGINRPRSAYNGTDDWWADSLNVNVIGPMRLLDAWLSFNYSELPWRHFSFVSSNSAVIPRSNSAAYCASKAALSMAVRCRARDAATNGVDASIYAYEFGLLHGTPMTKEVEDRLPGVPLTRMRGAAVENGLSVYGVAGHIVRNLAHGGPELNGVCLRLDAGEV